MFTRFDAAGRISGRVAISGVADAVIKAVKAGIRKSGTHNYGTLTPAASGNPPARISGTLYNSIDRTPITRQVFGYFTQIGTGANCYPPYAMTWRNPKPSSGYGLILDTAVLKNGNTYPFFYKTAEHVFDVVAPVIYAKLYGNASTVVRTI